MDKRCIYAVDIGDAYMRAGVHEAGVTVELAVMETPRGSTAAAGEQALLNAVADLVARLGTQAPPMEALAVSASGMMSLEAKPGARAYGPFKNEELYVMAPNVDGLKYVPLLSRLEAFGWGVPIHIENDVNAALESATELPNAVCISLGAGLGAAVKRDGAVQHPAGTWSCYEVGHGIRWSLQEEFFRKCHCGNHGCLEAAVGGWAITERYGVAPEFADASTYEAMRGDVIALLPPAIGHLVERTGITDVVLTGKGSHGYLADPASRERLRMAAESLDGRGRSLNLQLAALGDAAELHGVALALSRNCPAVEDSETIG